MKKGIFFLFCLTLGVEVHAQSSVVVQNVDIRVTGRRPHALFLPLFKDTINDNHAGLEIVNKRILEYFDLGHLEIHFRDTIVYKLEDDEYGWFVHSAYSEINDNYLYLKIEAAFVSNRAYDHEWEACFDLKTGKEYSGHFADFHHLFNSDSYVDFINTHWSPKTKNAYLAAMKCSPNGYYIEDYYVSSYQIQDDSITLKSGSYRDFPTMYWACAPFVNVKMSLKDLSKYLSDEGKLYIEQLIKHKASSVNQFNAKQELLKSIENGLYLFGEIDSLYPFTMYLTLDRVNHKAMGWYYYNKYKVKIELKGSVVDDQIMLDEQTTNGMGGIITITDETKDEFLKYFKYHGYIKGFYENTANESVMDIEFIDLLAAPR